MSEEEITKKESGKISRREFLKDAGIVVGSTAIGSALFLTACGEDKEVTKTVTNTQTATQTQVVTTTQQVGTVTQTQTQSVSKYVCPSCGQEFASVNVLKTHILEEHPLVPGNLVTIHVNGELHVIAVKSTETLRDTLREQLGLISIKDMCSGYGACGSCSVILNGRPVLSCMTITAECDGAIIETAEGIASSHHPLVEAYIKNQCMQCGYCTPGFIVTSKALLDHKPKPSEEDIRDILAGNICRCGTYPAHIRAVLEAAI